MVGNLEKYLKGGRKYFILYICKWCETKFLKKLKQYDMIKMLIVEYCFYLFNLDSSFLVSKGVFHFRTCIGILFDLFKYDFIWFIKSSYE